MKSKKKVIRLTESDLERLVQKIINEGTAGPEEKIKACLTKAGIKGVMSGALPPSCAAAAQNPGNDEALAKCMAKLTQLQGSDYVALAKVAMSAAGCITGGLTRSGSGGDGKWDEKYPGSRF